MRILNFGSLNIDHVYNVADFVKPGETISAENYSRFCGGKGLNQSIALARAGAEVLHAGRIGSDGLFLKEKLESSGVDCSLLEVAPEEPTGHAMIQVSAKGENCIVLFGGANMRISEEQILRSIRSMERGDFLLLQNEISRMREIMEAADRAGLRIFFNPAPMNERVFSYPLEQVDTFIVNEIEAAGLAGADPESGPEQVIRSLQTKYPSANLLMTLGASGAMYLGRTEKNEVFVPASNVEKVVDTTAAGDTFIGYFLAETSVGASPEQAMKTAAAASGLCVGRLGAADSIPFRRELECI